MHGLRCFAFEGIDDRDFVHNLIRIFVQLTILEQIGHQGMQAINRDELFRKIKRRSKVVHSGVQ